MRGQNKILTSSGQKHRTYFNLLHCCFRAIINKRYLLHKFIPIQVLINFNPTVNNIDMLQR